MWWQLSTEQQLNCICDQLAKEAVRQSLGFSDRSAPQLRLPRESAAVFVAGMKQTTDVAQDVRFELSRINAERFYTAPLGERRSDGSRQFGGLGRSKESFQAVDWVMLDAALAKKPQMYKQWLEKQGSGFCGTQQMVAHWDSSRDGKCPNCLQPGPASHLNMCPDADRTRLLRDMANQLGSWLEKNYAHPELLEWLPRYITLRGTRRSATCPTCCLRCSAWPLARTSFHGERLCRGSCQRRFSFSSGTRSSTRRRASRLPTGASCSYPRSCRCHMPSGFSATSLYTTRRRGRILAPCPSVAGTCWRSISAHLRSSRWQSSSNGCMR